MDRDEVFQALTLWFAAMIFLRTGSGNPEPVVTVVGVFAVVLTWAIPLYLVVGTALDRVYE